MHKEAGAIVQVFRVDVYAGYGDDLRLITDASPWGLGGVFCVNGWIAGYFSAEINDLSLNYLNMRKVTRRGNRPEKH